MILLFLVDLHLFEELLELGFLDYLLGSTDNYCQSLVGPVVVDLADPVVVDLVGPVVM